jgi:hypothetical protein
MGCVLTSKRCCCSNAYRPRCHPSQATDIHPIAAQFRIWTRQRAKVSARHGSVIEPLGGNGDTIQESELMAKRLDQPRQGPYPVGANFARLLDYHLRVGTRPHISHPERGPEWTNTEFAKVSLTTRATVRKWRRGDVRPRHITGILRALFGNSSMLLPMQLDLHEAWRKLTLGNTTHVNLESAEQRPAAYRFNVQDDKIDVLPEPPEPTDINIAQDILQELLNKARGLQERLSRTDSAERALNSVNGLLAALGTDFANLREGIILSRVRSIEADRYTYDTDEGRTELFPEAIALLDDTLRTAQDLLALFPKVRRIEAERIALELDRHPREIATIEQEMAAISQAAAASRAASEAAIEALTRTTALYRTPETPTQVSLATSYWW